MPFYAKLQTMKRLFVAVNLPEETKDILVEYQEKYKEVPGTWTKKENLHITLVFYGNASDKELEEIKKVVKEVVSLHKSFAVKLSKIAYGPSPSMARMIWTAGDTPKELVTIQKELATALDRSEKRPYSLHITLARLREWEFQRIDPEERPTINEEINIEIPCNSIEIMESKLRRGGAEYTVVQSFSLL